MIVLTLAILGRALSTSQIFGKPDFDKSTFDNDLRQQLARLNCLWFCVHVIVAINIGFC